MLDWNQLSARIAGFLVVCVAGSLSRIARADLTIITIPGSTETDAFGVNNSNEIVGLYYDGTGEHGFTWTNGAVTTINVPGADSTAATGVNDLGEVVGNYQVGNATYGFTDNNGVITTINSPGSTVTETWGINDSGTISGFYHDASGAAHGFIRDAAGNVTTYDAPGASATLLYGINNSGQVTGSFTQFDPTTGANNHGFFLDPDGTFAQIDVPGATGNGTIAYGINNLGEVIGGYEDPTHTDQAFILSNGSFSSYLVPGSLGSEGTGINDQDLTVGYYIPDPAPHEGYSADASDFSSGSLPEPSSLGVIGVIGAALVTHRKRRD